MDQVLLLPVCVAPWGCPTASELPRVVPGPPNTGGLVWPKQVFHSLSIRFNSPRKEAAVAWVAA